MKLDQFDLKVLDKALDIEETSSYGEESAVSRVTQTIPKGNRSADFEYARENIYDVIEQGKDAMSELLEIAKQSEHPRAFEVFGQLMERVTKASSDLMKLQRTEQEIENLSNGKFGGPKSVTNAIFVGSTKELSELIKGAKEKNIIQHEGN